MTKPHNKLKTTLIWIVVAIFAICWIGFITYCHVAGADRHDTHFAVFIVIGASAIVLVFIALLWLIEKFIKD